MSEISRKELDQLRLEFERLVSLRIDWLSLPEQSLSGFEPSQIAVIINTLLDAALPQIELLASDPQNADRLKHIGLSKAPRLIGQREGYPDYIHKSGKRVELKGLFVDNRDLPLKRPPTQREPSARLNEHVTQDEVDPEKDVLAVVAVKLQEIEGRCYPVIVDLILLSMIECIRARDNRLTESGGKWVEGVPVVVGKKGGFEKDTNFGKLKRIPYEPLQDFMRKHGAI